MNSLKEIGVRLPFVCIKTFEGTRREYEEVINRVWSSMEPVKVGKFSDKFPTHSVDDIHRFLVSNEEKIGVLQIKPGYDTYEDYMTALGTALIYFRYSLSKKIIEPVVNLHAIRESCVIEDYVTFDALLFKHFSHVDKSGIIEGSAAMHEFNTLNNQNVFDKMPVIIVAVVQ